LNLAFEIENGVVFVLCFYHFLLQWLIWLITWLCWFVTRHESYGLFGLDKQLICSLIYVW